MLFKEICTDKFARFFINSSTSIVAKIFRHMKKIYFSLKTFLLACSMVLLFSAARSQAFTAGNVAVIVASASANNTTANVVEFTTTGSGIVTHGIPDGASAANGLRFSGSATSTMYLSNSNDGSLLCFTGANSNNTIANVNTLNPRGAGTFNLAGTYNLATTYTGVSGNQTRAASSLDNSSFFLGDGGGFYTNNSISASPSGTIRSVRAFGGSTYAFTASASLAPVGIISLPTGGTYTALAGLPVGATTRQDFYLISSGTNSTTYDVLYVLDAASATVGTIFKYSLAGGVWTANGSYTTNFGGFGMACAKNGTGADIFVSTGTGASIANKLMKLNDAAGYNVAINITTASNVTLYTAAAGTIIKGVAFAPEAAAAIPSVSLSVSSTTGTEAGTTAITVTATATAAVSGAQTVTLAVTGTDITPGDFTLSNTTITIANGATASTVTFTVTDDALAESIETATLTISNPSAGITLGSPLTQNIVITDNDTVYPTVNLSVSSNTGSEQNATTITVTATASAPVSGNQTVTIAVSGLNITASDYLLSGATITILSAQTTGSVTFKIRNDAEPEAVETAVLTISNPSAGITPGTTLSQNVTIDDNTCQALIRKSTSASVNGAEISAFDPSTNRIFTVAGPAMEYYTLSNSGIISAPTNMLIGFISAGNNIVPNSVGVKNGVVAVSYAIADAVTLAQQPGVVAFYSAASAAYISQVTVGYLPDMLVFSPDGTKILTANEGEPNSYLQGNSFDPEGSISIINIAGGVATATVNTVGFTSFNGQLTALKAAGVRITGPGATVAQDLEPEYIAFSGDATTAYITLQENNAIAKLDIATATITQILPLGLKDHSVAGNGLDASDQDGATINITTRPVFGMYQPDAITSFNVGGNNYFITANEGDSRNYTGFNEEARVSTLTLDATVFPNAATLKTNASLGRMQVTNATGDTDGDGDFDQINAYGARSFSVWTPNFTQIFDSGDQLEQITAAQNPASFNSDGTPASFDSRSDNKGPEPEGATTGMVNGILYAFIGSERTGDVFVYDITNPAAPVFKQYIDNPQDVAVEGLIFVPAAESPTGKALVITSAEASKTISVYEFSLITNTLVAVNTVSTVIQGTVTAFGDCAGLVAQTAQNGAAPIAGSVTAKVFVQSAVPSFNSMPYVQRHYEITPAANATTATGRITLYFTQTEFNNFNANPNSALDLPTGTADAPGKANLMITKYPGESSDGSGLPATYTGAATIINPDDAAIIYNTSAARWEVSFDVTGFSGFFVQTNAVALPVTLLSFNGKATGNNSSLFWTSTNEINHASYEVQYSKDGSGFIPAGSLNASAGSGDKSYHFTHRNAAYIADKIYYRLKMISTGGVVSFSDIVIVRFGATDKLITDLYPSPTTGIMNIVRNAATSKPVNISIFDISGRRLLKTTLSNSALNTIDITGYTNGIYLLEASVPNGRKQQFKIVKQ